LEPSTLVDGGNITIGVPSEAVDILHEGLAGNSETVADALGVLALLRGFDCGVETVKIFERSMLLEDYARTNQLTQLRQALVWDSYLYCLSMWLFMSNMRKPKKQVELWRDEDQKQTDASLPPHMNSS
jgi:hypothetical protein